MSPRFLIGAILGMACSACAVIDGMQGGSERNDPPAAEWKWHGPVQLDQGLPSQSASPRLAVANDGTAWVTWYEWKNASQTASIWATRRAAGGEWETPKEFPTLPEWPVATYPHIAVGASGVPVIAFQANDGQAIPVRSIRATRLENGLTVELANIIRLDSSNSKTPQLSQMSSLAVDDGVNAVVAWGEDGGIWGSLSAGATGWSSPIQLDNTTSSNWGSISVVAGIGGTGLIGWSKGSVIEVVPVTFGANISMGSRETLASGTNLPGPSLAMRGDNALTAWKTDSGFSGRPYSTQWGRTDPIPGGQPDAWGNATIAINRKGQGVFVWRQFAGGASSYTGNLWASYFDGNVWSTGMLISSPGENRKAWWPAVDINEDGVAVVSWADFDEGGTFTRIWANVMKLEDGKPSWQGPVAIDEATPDAGLADQPENMRSISVAMDRGGKLACITYIQNEPGVIPRTWANWLE